MTAEPAATFLSAHARYAAHTARACGYGFASLDGADGYLFEVRDGARRAIFAAGAGSPYALNDARAASLARDKAFCAQALALAGVAAVPGRVFFVTRRWSEMRSPGREIEDALAFARGAAFPLFCKPIAASNGLYAELIEDGEAFSAYLARVGREHFAILAQPYVKAPEHRVFVLDGLVVFSYCKHPPELAGDGASTLAELARAAARFGAAATVWRDASGRRLDPGEVLARGARAIAIGPANRAAGGGAGLVCDGAEPTLAKLAIDAVEALGLRLGGVDIFDCRSQGGGAMVIEVNSNPMIATLEEQGRWDLIEAIWRANFEAALR